MHGARQTQANRAPQGARCGYQTAGWATVEQIKLNPARVQQKGVLQRRLQQPEALICT